MAAQEVAAAPVPGEFDVSSYMTKGQDEATKDFGALGVSGVSRHTTRKDRGSSSSSHPSTHPISHATGDGSLQGPSCVLGFLLQHLRCVPRLWPPTHPPAGYLTAFLPSPRFQLDHVSRIPEVGFQRGELGAVSAIAGRRRRLGLVCMSTRLTPPSAPLPYPPQRHPRPAVLRVAHGSGADPGHARGAVAAVHDDPR